VRQLENVLARAAALAEGEVIQIDDLEIIGSSSTVVAAQQSESHDLNFALEATVTQDMTSLAAVGGDLEGHMDSIERSILQNAMTEYRWNKTAAAKALGVSFRSLRYRLKKLGLED
jgi:two-component system response regulator PilR (NtrC family)